MTRQSSTALVQLYYQALNQDCLEMLDAHMAPGFAHHLQGVPPGWDSLKRILRQYRLGFRDLTTSVQRLLVADDHVTAHVLTRGTHTGEFLGHLPTGKSFVASGIEIFRVEAGCLMDRWGVFDTLTMLHQLGLYQPAQPYRLEV